MKGMGAGLWAAAGGRIPAASTGREPTFTSRDELAVLNPGSGEAELAITLFYEDREPVGPYALKVGPQRVRRVRLGDLIFPEALPLGVAYSALIEASRPVVVQFTRLDSSGAGEIAGTTAFPA